VDFKTRCAFPLSIKVYVLTQQEKDSLPEWVPDDFQDPDVVQVRARVHVCVCVRVCVYVCVCVCSGGWRDAAGQPMSICRVAPGCWQLSAVVACMRPPSLVGG
jgi:hypothetical protein